MLKTLGYSIGLQGIDGKFGSDTEKAVRQFQSENKDWNRNSIQADGLVGPITSDALNRRMVGRWYDIYETPRSATKNKLCITLTKELLRQGVKIDRGDTTEADIILTSPPFFNYEWQKEEGNLVTLCAKTTVPDGTPVRFIVYQSERPLTFPLPDSSTGRPRTEFGSELAVLKGKIEDGLCSAQWSYKDDLNPFEYHSWLVDLDVELGIITGEEDEVPADGSKESAAGIYDANTIKQPFFCIEAGEYWGHSSPPGQKINKISFANDNEVSGIAISTEGTLVGFNAKSGEINTHDFVEIVSLAARGKSIEAERQNGGEVVIG
jgi:hypothetical protein